MTKHGYRKGCKDIWNAFMCAGCTFSKNDIPYCPNKFKNIPSNIITYEEALSIYKRKYPKDKNFKYQAFVSFFLDDYKFDSSKGIWNSPSKAYKILRHFDGIVTPDFSTYLDFPDPLKRYNTYRSRAFGYWFGKCGGQVINSVRWGTQETFEYCFDGLPQNDVLVIGTVASGLNKLINRPIFDAGILELIERLHPKTIITYRFIKLSNF